MRVHIKKYPYRLTSNFFTRHMDKKYNFMWPEKQTVFENCFEKLEDVLQEIYNIANWVWFDRREQKISVHIDEDDWNYKKYINSNDKGE